jgi:predicted Fe-S protein YdhL (DUF1289 family)
MTCSCMCHLGPHYECDVTGGYDGGCGYLHGPPPEAEGVDTEHRCARGEQCAGRTPERNDRGEPTGRWLAAVISAERGLCDGCRRDLDNALNHLVGDVVELSMLIGHITPSAPGDIVSQSPTMKIPLQVNIEALRAEIDSEVQAWAEPVAEALGIEWDTDSMHRSRLTVRVQRAVHLLARAVDAMLSLGVQEHPAWIDGEPLWDGEGFQETTLRDGIDAAISLISLHRRAYSLLGRSKLVHRLDPPCPYCDHKKLVRHNGDDHVVCEGCHRTIAEKHYDWFVAVLVHEEERRAAAEKADSAA